ncbi:right-handed parallel beta-helix repeat-containing protein [Oscillatoria amoena NRMC-F 0135]|nr:right-handed parallel beta-helix repeat-containing protein [Oscillatoria amoena NRMC-F 0135]
MPKRTTFIVSSPITSLRQPAGRASCYKSLSDALEQVARLRKFNRGKLPGPVDILVEDGFYEMKKTLVIRPEHGGDENHPVTIRAARGARPVFSGGRRIAGWKPGRINGQACWVADLPEARRGRWHFTQLFVDGQRAARGRFPESGHLNFTGTPSGLKGFHWYTVDAAYFAGREIDARWKNPDDLEIVALQHWFDMHLKIKSIDPRRRLVHFKSKAIGPLYDEAGHGARYCIENVREMVRQPGQWYLDRPTGKLHYIPLPGQTPETTEIIAPALDTLIRIEGKSPEHCVRELHFQGVSFQHSQWTLPETNSGAVQAAFNIPGAITLRLSENCSFDRCEIAHIAQYAIENRRGARGTRVTQCHLHDLGGGGVKVLHEWNSMRPGEQGAKGFAGMNPVEYGWLPGNRTEARKLPRGTNVLVADCEIHGGGRIFHSAIGVWIGDAGGNRIRNNHIHDFYYTAVSCGWNWNYGRTHSLDNRIDHNHIHNIGQGLLSDMGAIYLLGPQPGLTLSHNRIHDVRCFGYGGAGIYPDQGSSYLTIENNIVYDCQSGAFSAHFGRDIILRNNILMAGPGAICHGIGRTECVQSYVCERNLILSVGGKAVSTLPPNARIDRNLYWFTRGSEPEFAGHTLADWQKAGYDRHSILADPKLGNIAKGDFSLASTSPAKKIGFRPIDTSKIGPRTNPRYSPHEAGFRDSSFTIRLVDDDHARALPKNHLDELLYQRIAWMLPAKQKTPFHIFAENFRSRPLQARVRLSIDPARAGKIFPPEVTFPVSSCAHASRTVHVEMSPGYQKAKIIATPLGQTASFPATSLLMTEQKTCEVGRLSKQDAKIRFDDLLTVPAREIRHAGRVSGSIRMALTKQKLWVMVEIHDALIERVDAAPWSGSCVEFFTSPNGKQCLRQYFLMPADGANPAKVSWANNLSVEDLPDTPCDCERSEDGYRLLVGLDRRHALVAESYGRNPGKVGDVLGAGQVPTPIAKKNAHFFAEAIARHKLSKDGSLLQSILLGAGLFASYDASGYALAKVQNSVS